MRRATKIMVDVYRPAAVCVLVTILLLSVRSTAAPPQTAPTTQPDSVDALLTALHGGDFKEAFKYCKIYQADIERLHTANPRVLWPKVEADYLASQERLFLRRDVPAPFGTFGQAQAPSEVVELAALLVGNETHKVEEKRADHLDGKDVTVNFVSIKYADEVAPWINGKLLKETMVKIVTETSSNLFLAVGRIGEADVFRDSAPLRIYAVVQKREAVNLDPLGMHGGTTFKTSVSVIVVGGKPNYQVVIRAPGFTARSQPMTAPMSALLYDAGGITDPRFEQDGFLDTCIVSVVGGGNNDSDVARFSTRGVKNAALGEINHMYIRKAWFDMGPRFGAACPIDWQNASSLATEDLQGIVKHFDQLDALKKLELASRKRTGTKDVHIYQFIAYPGLSSEGFVVSKTTQLTRWRASGPIVVRVGATNYPKAPVPLKQGDRFTFMPAGDAPVAVTVILYHRKPTEAERTADIPLLPEPAPDAAK